MFITLEGSEGSGKTSHIPRLAAELRRLGYNVLTTREPGGTPIGDQIRLILADHAHTAMHPRTETLLFLAARAQIVEEVIRPHLAQGGIVISDRYADSTLAYQGYGRGVDLDQLRSLLAFATCKLQPDLTLLLDLDVREGLQRRNREGNCNRLDALEVEFYERVRQGYLEMVQAEPQRWTIIDAAQPIDQVGQDLLTAILSRLEPKR